MPRPVTCLDERDNVSSFKFLVGGAKICHALLVYVLLREG